MKNPLYPSKLINYTNISNYNKCFIITLEKTHVPEIFEENVTHSYLENVKQNYKVSLIPMWIVKSINEYHKKFIMFEMTEDELLKFNFVGKDINDNDIIYDLSNACIFIPNHNWFWFHQYIEVYLIDGFKKLYTYLQDETYATLDIPFENIIKEIASSSDVTYWKNINKCMINITTAWLERDINFSDAKEININKQKEMTDACNNYLQDIYNKNKYVDASSGIKRKRYNLYYAEEYPNVPNDTMISNLVNDSDIPVKVKNEIINYGLTSKKYCHHFIKNDTALKYINNNIDIFIKAFGYSWLMMYLEEGIFKSWITEKNRCIFTLDQANKLPINNQQKNVYIPLMVEKMYINFFGGYQSTNNYQNIELSDMDTFRSRLKLFTNNINIDIFANLDWSNIAISGSVIPATCRKIDPLEKDGGFLTHEFFNTYYRDSDIDMMCDLPDYVSFIDKINYIVSVFRKNILNKCPTSTKPINIECIKSGVIQLTKKYVDEKYNGKITDQEAYNLYCVLKEKEIKQTDVTYAKIDELVTFENFKFYVYNTDEVKEPFIGENIKYKISSPYLSRPFEIFKIKYGFLATVSRFHLPCVRGYYDGKNVYLLPSAISALLTNKCIDYKYFAGVRSPFEIILKYVFRGYTIFLNKKELVKLYEYIKQSEKWREVFQWDNNHFKVNTFQSYYSNPLVFINKNVKYYDYRKYVEVNMVSPIISTLGYVVPLN